MSAEGPGEPIPKVEPLGAPVDPLRPTGRVDPEKATRVARGQMAAARKVLTAIVIAVGCAMVFLVVALVALRKAYS